MSKFAQRGAVVYGDDQRMAGGDCKAIHDCRDAAVGRNDVGEVEGAEGQVD
jgi:hypothetical protein